MADYKKLTKSEIDGLDLLIDHVRAGRPFYEPIAGNAERAAQAQREVARQEAAMFAQVFGPRPMGERRFTEEEEQALLDKLREALLKEPTLEDLVELRKSARIQE
jgi:uracil-DNA glycosylase